MSTKNGVPFPTLCRISRLPVPVAEYRFAPPRRWRFDWAWPAYRIALEQEGGVWTRGRHVRGQGAIDDMLKYSEAQIQGWIVLRCVPSALSSALTLSLIRRALEARA